MPRLVLAIPATKHGGEQRSKGKIPIGSLIRVSNEGDDADRRRAGNDRPRQGRQKLLHLPITEQSVLASAASSVLDRYAR